MESYVIRSVDKEIEKRILTGLIVDTKFCKEAMPALKYEYFEVDHIRVVSRWVHDYFLKYEKAPGQEVRSLFMSRKDKMKPETAELIEQFLSDLSSQYVEQEDIVFNSEYLLDQTLKFFKKREITLLMERAKGFILDDKIEEAEMEVSNYKKVGKEISKWVNPFSDDFIEEVLTEESGGLFKFPGDLGNLSGYLKRGWLVGFMGPRKRGKSWWLMEVCVQALLQNLKVVFVSLEMTKSGVGDRLIKRVTSFADEDKTYEYPVFDCYSNQEGSCTKKERKNKIALFKGGVKPSFRDADKKYMICDVCRGNGKNEFIPTSWWVPINRKKLSFGAVKKSMHGFSSMWGAENNFRMMVYPAFSANLENLKMDLDKLEDFEGFIPDIIVIDYADILLPESGKTISRETIGQTWMVLKNLAAVKNCLVITATQSNKKSAERTSVKQTDAAEDIRKIDHVDVMFSLNQTNEEKNNCRIRLGIVAHRWKEYDEYKSKVVLQQLKVGQTLLDSEDARNYRSDEEEEF